MNRDPARGKWLGYLGFLLAVVCAAITMRPASNGGLVVRGLDWRLPPSCWTRTWLGLECPGCGATRSFVFAASGDWRTAWEMHPAGTLLFGLILLQIPIACTGVVMGFRSHWRTRREAVYERFFKGRTLPFTVMVWVLLALAFWHWLAKVG